MHVQVVDLLTAVRIAIDDQPIAAPSDALLPGDVARNDDHVADQRLIVVGDICVNPVPPVVGVELAAGAGAAPPEMLKGSVEAWLKPVVVCEDEDFDEDDESAEDDDEPDDDESEEDEIELDTDDEADDIDDDIEVINGDSEGDSDDDADDDADDEDYDEDDSDEDDSDDEDVEDDDLATGEQPAEVTAPPGRHRRRAAARPAGPPAHDD